MEFLGTNRAKIYLIQGKKLPKIVINGYVYGINRRCQDRTFWLCSSYYRKDKCTARVTTIGNRTAKLSNEHNHPPPNDTIIAGDTKYTIVTILGR